MNQVDQGKNIILFIGDGTGSSQIFSGMIPNNGELNLEYIKYIGFSKTQAYDNYVTQIPARLSRF